MSYYGFEKEVLALPFFTIQVVKVVQDTKEKVQVNGVKAKLTTVTLVEVPFQNMLNVRPVTQNSLIWFDEKEKEVAIKEKTKEDDSNTDESESDEEEDKSPHDFYRDMVSA